MKRMTNNNMPIGALTKMALQGLQWVTKRGILLFVWAIVPHALFCLVKHWGESSIN